MGPQVRRPAGGGIGNVKGKLAIVMSVAAIAVSGITYLPHVLSARPSEAEREWAASPDFASFSVNATISPDRHSCIVEWIKPPPDKEIPEQLRRAAAICAQPTHDVHVLEAGHQPDPE